MRKGSLSFSTALAEDDGATPKHWLAGDSDVH